MTGFDSKRQAALDKLFEAENELGLHYDQRTLMTKDKALKLALEALEIGPWTQGSAWCLNCPHEWIAVWPLGAESLECPVCGSTDTDREQEEPHNRKNK